MDMDMNRLSKWANAIDEKGGCFDIFGSED